MVSLNHQNFPFIYMNVAVDTFDVGFPDLDQGNFAVYENNILQTDYFEIQPPESGGGSRLADIIFVLDVTGSMDDEINAVKQNMLNFVNTLAESDIDYTIGFVVFGDIVYTYNSGNLYYDESEILRIINNIQLGENGIGNGDDTPENQLGAMAEAATNINYRPGAQRIEIMLTDAESHTDDYVTELTVSSLIDKLIAANITVFPVFDNYEYLQRQQYIPVAEATNPTGVYYHIYDNFNDIIEQISTSIAATYLLRYKSSNPIADGTLRTVRVGVQHASDEAECEGTYIPGSMPKITRTEDTIALHDRAWADGTEFTIEVKITDEAPPFAQNATLFYRNSLASDYRSMRMTNVSGDLWQGTIYGGYVNSPGVDYYVTATDGENTASNPSVDPVNNPHNIAILPNEAPKITHTPVTTLTPGTPISITAEIVDNTNLLEGAILYYRKIGQLIYEEVEMNNTFSNQFSADIPADYITNAGAEYYVKAWDDFGVNGYSGTADRPHQIYAIGAILVVKDASAEHNLIRNKEFHIYKVDKTHPEVQYLKGKLTTDDSGKLELPGNWFETNDLVKIQRTVDTVDVAKGRHEAVDDVMYYVDLDNAVFDNDGDISFHTFSASDDQEVILGHTTLKFNLVISVEWDASQEYLENLEKGFRLTSNYWYDVSDGQLCINKIAIYDNKQLWDSCDVRIYANNQQWPQATVFLGDVKLGGGIRSNEDTHLYMPRIFYYNSYDSQRNLTDSLYPYNWSIKNIPGHNNVIYAPSRTIAHEFGHYGIGFMDEYINNAKQRIFPSGGTPTFHFGLMDDQLKIDPQNSEMSSILQYADNSHRITYQWTERGNRSCWDYFEWEFEDTYNDIFAPILKPDERIPLDAMFAGPNDAIESPNYDVGQLMTADNDHNYNGNAFVFEIINRDGLGFPIPKSKTKLFKNNRTVEIMQGKTADNGKIKCLGVNNGDIIRCNARIDWDVFYSELIVGEPGLGKFNTTYKSYPSGDSVVVILNKVEGKYSIINDLSFQDNNTITYHLKLNKPLQQTPSLELHRESHGLEQFSFSGTYSEYISKNINLDSGNHSFSIIGIDSLSRPFFIDTECKVDRISQQLLSHDASCVINIDTLGTELEKYAILSSEFTPILNGLDKDAELGGAIHSIATYPDVKELNNDNYLTIRYSDSDLTQNAEIDLRIHKWSSIDDRWHLIGGEVDTTRNEVTAQIESFGVYAAFTTTIAESPGTGGNLIPENIYIYPNPFNPDMESGTIRYSLAKAAAVTIKIYDAAMQLVATLLTDEPQQADVEQAVIWNGTNDMGEIVANGVYFYVIESSAGERAVGKAAVLR